MTRRGGYFRGVPTTAGSMKRLADAMECGGTGMSKDRASSGRKVCRFCMRKHFENGLRYSDEEERYGTGLSVLLWRM